MANGESRLEVVKRFRDKAKMYADLAKRENANQKPALASLCSRTSQGLMACAKAIEIGGISAMDGSGNICVQAVAAFTHGLGPKGIRFKEIKRFTRDGLRGKSHFRRLGLFNYAEKITRRQRSLRCEALTIPNPAFETGLMEQLVAPGVVTSWMLQRLNGRILHVVAIPNIPGLKENEVTVFDTGSLEHPLNIRSAKSLLDSGVGVTSDDGSRWLCGVRFLSD